MLLRGSRQMFQETKVGQTTAKNDLMRFTSLNQLLNEPQLKHVQTNENSVVSEPLQRACCRPTFRTLPRKGGRASLEVFEEARRHNSK